MSSLLIALLSVAVVAIGLVAGYVFGYANSVMPGMRKADDRTFVAANQRLNEAVHNPIFMAASNAGPLSLLVALGVQILHFHTVGLIVLIAGSLISYGATLFVTLTLNVPLNNRIIGLGDILDDAKSLQQARWEFERKWTRMNLVRTYTTVVSFILAIGALIVAVST